MLVSFMRQSVTVRRAAATTDAHGVKVYDWPNAVDTIAEGCSVQPGASVEVLGGRDTSSVVWTVFAPPSIDVVPTDMVIVGGESYAVNGHPLRWPSPTGVLDHVVIALERWVEHG